jgi:hypothetical protein
MFDVSNFSDGNAILQLSPRMPRIWRRPLKFALDGSVVLQADIEQGPGDLRGPARPM